MNRLTYIASGCSYTRFQLKDVATSRETIDWIRDAFVYMNRDKNHDFGCLYNAWTEANFGPILHDLYRDVLAEIQADSGGLQIVTQGKTIDDKMMAEVFKNQGSYSSMAMSFDEIPLSFSGAKSSRLDLSNRWFDQEKFEACAIQTGKNVEKQIQAFLDMKTETKPIFITQGNCYETYMRWTELAMQQIPLEHQEHIGGVAMGAAALGHGMLEDIQRAFFYTQLPMINKNNHLHLLAVGSVFRLVPNLIFLKSGLYKDMHLTYDSTSHTSASTLGRVYINNRYIDFPRNFDRILYQKIYDDVCSKFDIGMSLEDFHFCINTNSTLYKKRFDNIKGFVTAQFAIILNTIQNFKDHVDLCMNSDDEIVKQIDSRDNPGFVRSLYDIQTKEDFDHWMVEVGKYLSSKPVQSNKPISLEDLDF